jgi:P27 family predicted phage terminase small subunit
MGQKKSEKRNWGGGFELAAGRKPKATVLKLVTGNPGGRALNLKEPKIAPSIPKPPEFLGEIAIKEWQRLAPLLYKMQVLTEVDSTTLAAYCAAYETFYRAELELRDVKLVVKSGNGSLYQHPLVGIRNTAAKDMKVYAAEFGMTPSARSKITTAEPKKDDPAEKYF